MRCFEGNEKETPKLCQDSLGNVSKSLWRPFEKYLKGIGDSLKMPKEYWRPFQQPLPSSGYTLGNAQIEVETPWAHFPMCFQPIGRKDTPSVYCPPCLSI